jgi:hypothetical protein
MALVSHQSSRIPKIPVSDALPEVARAPPVLWVFAGTSAVWRQFGALRKAWRYWLSRHSSKSAIGWEKFQRLLQTYILPTPKIVRTI